MNSADEKIIVRDYFNATGFERWRRIYGDGQVNLVQKDIRNGHQQSIDTAIDWLEADGNLQGLSICDAGCGVGSLSIPLAQLGARVYASDISEKMVGEAWQRAKQSLPIDRDVAFTAQDLESLSGSYHTVICLDVLIHYPAEDAKQMLRHLASLAESRLILSFAPKTILLSMLKKVGEFFPGSSKATRAYQHKEGDIIQLLGDLGFAVRRNAMTGTRFYFSRILEAVRD